MDLPIFLVRRYKLYEINFIIEYSVGLKRPTWQRTERYQSCLSKVRTYRLTYRSRRHIGPNRNKDST